MLNPFFSVCIPVYNGGNIILKTLKSLEQQTFKDFEVIIVDNDSKDGTYQNVKNYLERSNLNYRLYKNDKLISMVKNWNEPIKKAKGKYIAVLHHDDSFKPEHLELAHDILIKKGNIGIYSAGNQYFPRAKTGYINQKEYFRDIYKMTEVSAPSETIFIRCSKNKTFLYNENYVYAPEIELYLEIASDGLEIFHNKARTNLRTEDLDKVIRVTDSIFFYWIGLVDSFKVIEKYKNHQFINKDIFQFALKKQLTKAMKRYIISRWNNFGEPGVILNNVCDIISKNKLIYVLIKLICIKTFLDLLIKPRIMHSLAIFIKTSINKSKIVTRIFEYII